MEEELIKSISNFAKSKLEEEADISLRQGYLTNAERLASYMNMIGGVSSMDSNVIQEQSLNSLVESDTRQETALHSLIESSTRQETALHSLIESSTRQETLLGNIHNTLNGIATQLSDIAESIKKA